jgi:hypothetical protein
MKGEGWHVIKDGEIVSTHKTQRASEAAAMEPGWEASSGGGLGQAVLHKSNGTIRIEYTYGEDPVEHPE